MKMYFLSFVFLFISIISEAQNKFLQGYYISNENQRVEGLIQSTGWRKTPRDFNFKSSDTSVIITISPIHVHEFGINDSYRYISADVQIDRSSDVEESYSEEKYPVWSEEKLFLLVLVDGAASLYQYKEESLERFFFKTDTSGIKQLIFRHYFPEKGDQSIVKLDASFRRQLWSEVRSSDVTVNSIGELDYDQASLKKYFIDFNKSKGIPYVVYTRKKELPSYHLRITPGVNYSTYSVIENVTFSEEFTFNSSVSFRIGVENELILPYVNKKVGLVVEPTFQYFNSSGSFNGFDNSVHFYTIEFPVGVRYYVFLGKNWKLFCNAFYVPYVGVLMNAEINLFDYPDMKIVRDNCFAIGGGFNWKRFGAEFRYYTVQKNLSGPYYMHSRYLRYSLILGYRIF